MSSTMKIGRFSEKVKNNEPEITFKKIIAEIRADKELEEIYLRANGLAEKQIEQLADALTEHRYLRFLELSYNEIHGAAIPFLIKIIQQHPELKLIKLRYNEIKDDDIEALVTANLSEGRIRSVDFHLDCNDITEKGLKRAQGILSPASILSILSGNGILDQELDAQCTASALAELNANKAALIFSQAPETKSTHDDVTSKISTLPLKAGSPVSTNRK